MVGRGVPSVDIRNPRSTQRAATQRHRIPRLVDPPTGTDELLESASAAVQMTQVLAWADYVVWLDGPEGPGDRFFQMFDNQYRTNSKKPLLTTYDVDECAQVFSETKELPVSQAQLKGLLTGHNVYHGGCAIVAFDPPAPEPAGNAAYHAAVKKWWKNQGVGVYW